MIQKSARKLGDWETLFLISIFGVIVLFPFVYRNIPEILFDDGYRLLILLATSIILLLAALVDFEALKKGKLAVVEPLWSFEVPVAAVLAFTILHERISVLQIVLILLLVACLFLVSFKEKTFSKKFFMEKGVLLAVIGAIFMGSANFFMGWGGRISDPLMINFFVNVFITVVTGIYLIANGKTKSVISDIKNKYQLILPMAISDNVAWVAFVFSMSLAPIAVAVALSESYIIIAVLLGLMINREKLQSHQKFGLIGAIITAIVLAAVTAG